MPEDTIGGMFIQMAGSDPRGYVMWIFAVVVSIVLHELAHGWMAVRLGDDTPIRMGRMTGNPLVHMGGFSLLVLFVFGIAWGQMPIDHTRLRGRYSEAKVAAAGPAMNLMLALVALVGLGLWFRLGVVDGSIDFQVNLKDFLFSFGWVNLLLCMFNLLPLPPLDGSHIMANLNHRYARFVSDPNHQQIILFGFFFAFVFVQALWGWAAIWANQIVQLVAGG